MLGQGQPGHPRPVPAIPPGCLGIPWLCPCGSGALRTAPGLTPGKAEVVLEWMCNFLKAFPVVCSCVIASFHVG